MKTSSLHRLQLPFYFPIWEICWSTGDKVLPPRTCCWVKLQILVQKQNTEPPPLAVSLPVPHNRGSAPPALIFGFKQSSLSKGHSTPGFQRGTPWARKKETLFHQVLRKEKDRQEMTGKCSTCRTEFMGNVKTHKRSSRTQSKTWKMLRDRRNRG